MPYDQMYGFQSTSNYRSSEVNYYRPSDQQNSKLQNLELEALFGASAFDLANLVPKHLNVSIS
ncbi:MAG: hypothetical protein MJ189_01050, partial [Coriobacteriales bacterium]|nr:hypothetical protein [Coriobacteriales bacterium]